jgi:hypothetical protein
MTWGDEIPHSDRPATYHSRLPTLQTERPSHRDAAVKPADLQAEPTELKEQPMEMPGPPRTAREVTMQEEPTELRTSGTATETRKETGLRRELLAALPPLWVAATYAL